MMSSNPPSLPDLLSLALLIDPPFPIASLSIYFAVLTLILILLTLVYLPVCFFFNLAHLLRD